MLFFPEQETFSHVQSEGALCVWEWMLENRNNLKPLKAAWGTHGTVAMRHAAIQVGVWADAAYKEMERQGYGYDAPYDWEFVPDFCSRLDWEGFATPDIPAVLAVMVTDDKERPHGNFYRMWGRERTA